MKLFKRNSKGPGEPNLRFPWSLDPDLADIAACSKFLKVSIAFNFVLAVILVSSIAYGILRDTTYRSATNEMRIEMMDPFRTEPHNPATVFESVVLDQEKEG